jgi:hypothetical protein
MTQQATANRPAATGDIIREHVVTAPGRRTGGTTTCRSETAGTSSQPGALDLAALRDEFPGFRIWRETIGDRVRYIARSLHTDTGPHTVVSADLDEIRAVLNAAACRQAAAHLRQQHSGWVVIWLAQRALYRAWPLFRAPRGTNLTAETPEQMNAQMDEVERAAQRPAAGSRRMDG